MNIEKKLTKEYYQKLAKEYSDNLTRESGIFTRSDVEFAIYKGRVEAREEIIDIFNSLAKQVHILGATREIVYKDDFEFMLKEKLEEQQKNKGEG